ncbi:2-alkenal reductase (NADP(+)-dependent) [Linum grandiflorum]
MLDKRITIQGFLSADSWTFFPEFISTTCDYLSSGKMVSLEDISIGLETIPSAFVRLFTGCNLGKKIIQISEDCD